MSSRKVADAHVQFTTKGLDSVKRDINEAANQLRALGKSAGSENVFRQMQSNLRLPKSFTSDISKLMDLQKNLRVAIALNKELNKPIGTIANRSASNTFQAGISADRINSTKRAAANSDKAIASRQGDAMASSPALRAATAVAIKSSLNNLKGDRNAIAKMIADSQTLSPSFKAKTAGVSSLNIQKNAAPFQMRNEADKIRAMVDGVKAFGRAGTKTAAEVNQFREEMERLARALEISAKQAEDLAAASARSSSLGVRGQGALRGSIRDEAMSKERVDAILGRQEGREFQKMNPREALSRRIGEADSLRSTMTTSDMNQEIGAATQVIAASMRDLAQQIRESPIDDALTALARDFGAGNLSKQDLKNGVTFKNSMRQGNQSAGKFIDSANFNAREGMSEGSAKQFGELEALREREAVLVRLTGSINGLSVAEREMNQAELTAIQTEIQHKQSLHELSQAADDYRAGRISADEYNLGNTTRGVQQQGAAAGRDTISEGQFAAANGGRSTKTESIDAEVKALEERKQALEAAAKSGALLTADEKARNAVEQETVENQIRLKQSQRDVSAAIDKEKAKLTPLLAARNNLLNIQNKNGKLNRTETRDLRDLELQISRVHKNIESMSPALSGSNAMLNRAGDMSRRWNFQLQQASYGVQDFVQVIGQTGLSGALRASANNMASFFAASGTTGGAIAGGLGTIAMIGLADAIQHMGWESETTAEKLDKLNRKLERTFELRKGVSSFSEAMFGGNIGDFESSISSMNAGMTEMLSMSMSDSQANARAKNTADEVISSEQTVSGKPGMWNGLKDFLFQQGRDIYRDFVPTYTGSFDTQAVAERRLTRGGNEKERKAAASAELEKQKREKENSYGNDLWKFNPKSKELERKDLSELDKEAFLEYQRISLEIVNADENTAEGQLAIASAFDSGNEEIKKSLEEVRKQSDRMKQLAGDQKDYLIRFQESVNKYVEDSIEGLAFGGQASGISSSKSLIDSISKQRAKVRVSEDQVSRAQEGPYKIQAASNLQQQQAILNELINALGKLTTETIKLQASFPGIASTISGGIEETNRARREREDAVGPDQQYNRMAGNMLAESISRVVMDFNGKVVRRIGETQEEANIREKKRLDDEIAKILASVDKEDDALIPYLEMAKRKIGTNDNDAQSKTSTTPIESLHQKIQDSLSADTKDFDLQVEQRDLLKQLVDIGNRPFPKMPLTDRQADEGGLSQKSANEKAAENHRKRQEEAAAGGKMPTQEEVGELEKKYKEAFEKAREAQSEIHKTKPNTKERDEAEKKWVQAERDSYRAYDEKDNAVKRRKAGNEGQMSVPAPKFQYDGTVLPGAQQKLGRTAANPEITGFKSAANHDAGLLEKMAAEKPIPMGNSDPDLYRMNRILDDAGKASASNVFNKGDRELSGHDNRSKKYKEIAAKNAEARAGRRGYTGNSFDQSQANARRAVMDEGYSGYGSKGSAFTGSKDSFHGARRGGAVSDFAGKGPAFVDGFGGRRSRGLTESQQRAIQSPKEEFGPRIMPTGPKITGENVNYLMPPSGKHVASMGSSTNATAQARHIQNVKDAATSGIPAITGSNVHDNLGEVNPKSYAVGAKSAFRRTPGTKSRDLDVEAATAAGIPLSTPNQGVAKQGLRTSMRDDYIRSGAPREKHLAEKAAAAEKAYEKRKADKELSDSLRDSTYNSAEAGVDLKKQRRRSSGRHKTSWMENYENGKVGPDSRLESQPMNPGLQSNVDSNARTQTENVVGKSDEYLKSTAETLKEMLTLMKKDGPDNSLKFG
jgi:hypothetical protein